MDVQLRFGKIPSKTSLAGNGRVDSTFPRQFIPNGNRSFYRECMRIFRTSTMRFQKLPADQPTGDPIGHD